MRQDCAGEAATAVFSKARRLRLGLAAGPRARETPPRGGAGLKTGDRRVMDVSRRGYFLAERGGLIVYCNAALCAMLGRQGQDLRRMRVFELGPDCAPETWAALRRLVDCSGFCVLPSRMYSKAGELLSVEMEVGLYPREHGTLYYGIVDTPAPLEALRDA